MRAYIAVVLLTAGFVAPALAETAPSLVNVQQPDTERAAQLQRQKAYRRAAPTRAAQAKRTRATTNAPGGVAQSSGPTRIVPGSQVAPAASSSSNWSSSMLSWWRGDSTPPGAGQGTAAQVSAEPAAARVETAAATTEPVKTTRRKARRTRRSEPTATGAVPETQQAEAKAEKPTRSKRRSAKRSRSRDRQVAARTNAARLVERSRDKAPPEPRPKPVNSATQEAAPQAAEADSAVGSISPAEVKKSGGSQMAALSSERAAGGEATWWQHQGNPVVYNFRDCVASYASREAQRNKDGTWADLLIRATEGDCRGPFDEMARTLAKRFGETRIEPVMRELIDTTFLPAAKQAAAESAPASAAPSSDIPPLPPIPDNVPTQ
jgi:hypothetical protein